MYTQHKNALTFKFITEKGNNNINNNNNLKMKQEFIIPKKYSLNNTYINNYTLKAKFVDF